MNFNEAIKLLQDGKMMRRSSWDIHHGFIFRQIPSRVDKEIVPKMTSVPQEVKEEFQRRFDDPTYQIDAIYYSHQFARVEPSNIITGFSPSVEDVEAIDWELYKA